MITVEDVRVVFNPGTVLETVGLDGISLTLEPGQMVTVIGSNGAGKSTLLNVIAGDVMASRGRIAVDGQDVTRWSQERRAALVARVFQDPLAGSFESLTIEENLAIAGRRGRHRGFGLAIDNRAREGFRQELAGLGLGLEHRLGERMDRLSGGQRQAVSLLATCLAPTKLLLLDEHTAALDPKIAAFVLKLTDRLVTERNLTTLMVTHSMRQALDHGNRTIMLHEGKIVFDVSGEERERLDVADLVELFSQRRGEALADDALLL
ncbi:MAG: ABC transporter ATP-binding protein [Geminicoccaceae bacterium]